METAKFPQDQISELKHLFGNEISIVHEGNNGYLYIPNVKIPGGVDTECVDLLFCPTPWGGYKSRLFYSRQIKTKKQQNWNNVNVSIAGKNWFAFSWETLEGLRLVETIMIYLEAAK